MEPNLAEPSLARRLTAELVGTFVLVLGGTGAAAIAAKFPTTGIGFVGVALAFGLTVLGCAYALGPISPRHAPDRRLAGGVRVDALARIPLSFPTYIGMLGRAAAVAARRLSIDSGRDEPLTTA